jgi:precorrin-2 dehydrogenase/sirohydrochlorin ferrochelatase
VIPLFCDLADKRVVILGGGRVALRKARRFAPEADVSVHAPAFAAGFGDLPCETVRERVDADRAHELLDKTFLAVVATDDADLNARFTRVAREQNCLVNRTDRSGNGDGDRDATGNEADATGETSDGSATASGGSAEERPSELAAEATSSDAETGDVIVPSSIEAGRISVAISTGGSSPAMAKYLRRRLEPVLEESEPMVRLQRDLRAELKRSVTGSAERRERLWRVIESETVWAALDAGEERRARRLARERAGLPIER